MYLFDTDTITNLLKKQPSEELITRLQSLSFIEQFISTITIGEIVYGAYKSHNPERHIDNLNNILLPSVNIISFSIEEAFQYGKIRAELEKKGVSLFHTDIQIASIAITNNLILITGNIKHFNKIKKLKVENWL